MKTVLLACGFFCCAVIPAHSQDLVRQAVANAGHSATVGYTIFQYTIGEPVVATLSAGDLLLTQGFQQPEVAGPIKAPEAPFVSDLIVYPNPAAEFTNLEFDLLQDGRVVFMLVNNAGQVVFTETSQMLAGRLKYTMALSNYASGLYYLVIRTAYRTYTEKLVIQ
ncbi:T9SS type A sorting domain-containing protein [Parapedobacter pyrenivorans]|uniref:T9SS type A sorting domain-containing protein n=1 Tax=Parapedobacter pyrenivorans TaxID=1305674 RepID=UPI00166E0C91|nr:T9SS type A sorting domain-containing protein [Parapedobacter pyrenivorans]